MKLVLDMHVYSLEAAQKAAYRFIDRLTILIQREEDKLVCEIDPIDAHKENFEDHVANFKRELLDQQLRHQIKNETESTRNLILSFAFSRSGLQG